MKLKYAFLSLFLVFCLTNVGAATSVTPTKETVTQIMLDYDLQGQNNSYELACSIGQNVSEEYNINVDIRELKFSNGHQNAYIDVFYPKSDNQKGYLAYYGWFGPQKKEIIGFTGKDQSMYYKDWGSSENNGCRIVGVCSYPIVKSYFGTTAKMEIVDNVSNETIVKDDNTSVVETNNTSFSQDVNSSVVTIVSDSGNTVQNFTGESNIQGNNNTVVQGNFIQNILISISNLENSTVNFIGDNFYGKHK